jgi:hypothetical protein
MISESSAPESFRGAIRLAALTSYYPAPEYRTSCPQLRRARFLLLEIAETGGFLLIRVKYNAVPVDTNDTLAVCGDAILLPECPSSDEVYRLMDLPMPSCAGVIFNCYDHGKRPLVTAVKRYTSRQFEDDLMAELLGPYRPDSLNKISRERRQLTAQESFL